MKIFSRLYTWVMGLARHNNAPYYLAALSVAESSFFPIPPDVMLAPMSMARPQRAWFYAGLTALCSVVGGALGYCLGYIAYTAIIESLLVQMNYMEHYQMVVTWFHAWGMWILLFSGFMFIPYKLFTIAAGALQMPFLPFIAASLFTRSVRFFLVAAIMRRGGEKLEGRLHKWVDWLGWGIVGLIALALGLRYAL